MNNSHKTAISRRGPSYLAKLAVGLIDELKVKYVLDWGCGRGSDVEYYNEQGLRAFGWDPHYRPALQIPRKNKADLVTCAYVLNVIDTEDERIKTLRKAKKYLRRGGHILICARSAHEITKQAVDNRWRPMGDGYLTKSGTFQAGLSNYDLVQALRWAGFEVIDTNVLAGPSWALGRKK
jgi:DNA phosphorothioation-associated putative methyltransferase